MPDRQGEIVLDETITISTKRSISAGISSDIVETCLGITVEDSYSFDVRWTGVYNNSVILKVFPIYEVTTGVLWEDDVIEDDNLGPFTIKKPIGDEIRVYRNGVYQ